MRATRVLRFVLFGAIGFGIGGGIAGSITVNPVGRSLLALLLFLLGLVVIGTLGGASLGLAMRDRRKAVVLALWGAAGFCLGFLVAVIGLVFALLLGGAYIHWPASFYMEYGFLTAVTGAVGGVALGAALRSRRSILALALAGFVGFGIGDTLGLPGISEILQGLLAGKRYNPGLFAATQVVGGASLGAALGYLEKRKLAQGQRPRPRAILPS